MPFSTESALPMTWPVDGLRLELLAQLFGCSIDEARARRTALASNHADSAWLDRTLAALSVPALCIATALASHGGMLHDPELDRHVLAMGVEQAAMDAGIFELLELLLIAPLESARGRCHALTASAAAQLAARVGGLELVPLARASFIADPQDDGGRSLLAVSMALATASLRLTTAGAPHRTRLKKLANQLAHDPVALEQAIEAALELGLVRVNGDDELVPVLDALRAVAEGRYPHLPALEELAGWMRDGAPVEISSLETYGESSMYRGVTPISVGPLGRLPGFTKGTVDQRPALVLTEPAGVAAASVTPSFEVFIPPESAPRDLVAMLSVCEITRIDRAIVARITKASVTRAIGAGATGDQIVQAFASATRTPLPQNVETALRDWAGNASTATIDRGTVVTVAASEQGRVLAALPNARVLAPGVLIVPETFPARAVSAALRKLGILERTPSVAAGEPAAAPATTARRGSPAVGTAITPSALALRARLAAYRRGDPHERGLVRRVVRAPAPSPSPHVAAESEIQMLTHRVERWENQRGEVLTIDGFEALVVVLEALSPVDRQFVLAARNRAELAKRLTVMTSSPALAGLDRDLRDDLENELGCGPSAPARPRALEWHRDHLLARLEAAAKTRSSVVLDLGDRSPTIAVTKLVTRGNAVMVLGEDMDEVSHAIRYDEIRAVADAPPREPEPGAARWRPAAGMEPPAGHTRCPCKSGRRYRDCCRTAPDPS